MGFSDAIDLFVVTSSGTLTEMSTFRHPFYLLYDFLEIRIHITIWWYFSKICLFFYKKVSFVTDHLLLQDEYYLSEQWEYRTGCL